MVLSKREQIILVGTLLVVGLLIGDRIVFTPVWKTMKDMGAERTELKGKIDSADLLFAEETALGDKWKMLRTTFANADEAQSKVSASLSQWATKYRLKMSATRPERIPSDKGLQEMQFNFSGTGTLSSVASFVWEIETSPLPLKVTSMQLSSNDAGEQMQITLNVSAIYPGTSPSTNKRAPSRAEAAPTPEEG